MASSQMTHLGPFLAVLRLDVSYVHIRGDGSHLEDWMASDSTVLI